MPTDNFDVETQQRRWMSISDFCDELDVTAWTAYKWSASGPESGRFPRFRKLPNGRIRTAGTGSRNGWMTLAPRRNERPSQPWRPRTFNIYGIYRRTNKGGNAKGIHNRHAYDIRYVVDGHQLSRTFSQRGWAEAFAFELAQDFALGLMFNPQSRRFDRDASGRDDDRPGEMTVFRFMQQYVHQQWHRWEPATRRGAQPDLARACVLLVRENAPALVHKDRLIADQVLRDAILTVPPPPTITNEHLHWIDWFERWSLPMISVHDEHLRALMEDVRTHARDGSVRVLASTSEARTRAVIRGAFSQARRQRIIDWDPWAAVLPVELNLDPRVPRAQEGRTM